MSQLELFDDMEVWFRCYLPQVMEECNKETQLLQWYKDKKLQKKVRISEYIKNKKINDQSFGIAHRLRGGTRRIFNKETKLLLTEQIIGTDWQTVTDYLNSLGYDKTIHDLDHIIPLSVFNLIDKEHQRIACYYTNLQPLDPYYNRYIKRNKLYPNWKQTIIDIANRIQINPEPIIEYIEKQNIPILYEEKAV